MNVSQPLMSKETHMRKIDEIKFDRFFGVYAKQLERAHTEGHYAWSVELLPTVINRMKDAIKSGSYNVAYLRIPYRIR